MVQQHELVHAAQHCYGGTLSTNPYLKAQYFNHPPGLIDYKEVIEIYPMGEWVNELEARAGVYSGDSMDYATLLYLTCKVFSKR
jgi:hypothetical protein